MAALNFGAALSVTDVKAKMLRLKQSCATGKTFISIRFTIEDIEKPIVILKHEVGNDTSCRGTIAPNGVCRACGVAAPGVKSYSMNMLIADIEDEKVTLEVKGADKAGDSMFKMTATQFDALEPTIQADLIEKTMCVPTYAKLVLQYRVENDSFMAAIYNVEQLPM